MEQYGQVWVWLQPLGEIFIIISDINTSTNSTTMAPIDWSDRITQLNKGFCEIPKDVKFKIVETDCGEESKTGLVQEVEAHRMVLAMASDVFRTMFYGSGGMYQDVKEGEVVIKDTTKEAFEIMIGAVYNTVSMEESLKD